MIADQQIGTNFMKALGYNLRKLNLADPSRRPELLDTNFTSPELPHIKKEVDLIRQLRPRLSKYVYHTSLNFSKEEIDSLDKQTLLSIAHDYLQGMGFTNNQYFIFRHHDAGHPHIHLLVNRICFDGSVVSDSNNFKRSEAILRKLEYQYNLIPVEQSSYRVIEQANGIAIKRHSYRADRAPKKDELEMVLRTGKPSDKMVLQEKLKKLLNLNMSLQEFIKDAERQGIHLLFNQASTGRISGITYFYNNFKAKGQALGNRFRWGEIIKLIYYEQNRDSKAVSEANSRTIAKYGEIGQPTGTGKTEQRNRTDELYRRGSENPGPDGRQPGLNDEIVRTDGSDRAETRQGNALNDHIAHDSNDNHIDRFNDTIDIQISNDIDDEAIHGRNRHRKKQARTNTR
ncbi:MAG TPA: relaxase/mobilization nuclease domain-containing protein [Mucilaginibacter sp.]|jgi:hypothetical protein